ncbi:unnamed protein product [Rotaria sp. Silwood1]|nr:unnamed protein product [Rotaria sp. Silwood1]
MNTTSNTVSSTLLALPYQLNICIGLFIWVTGNIGCIGNAIVFSSRTLSKRAYAVYLLWEALSDFIYFNFLLLTRILQKGFQIPITTNYEIICKLRQFDSVWNHDVSLSLFSFATIDRILSAQRLNNQVGASTITTRLSLPMLDDGICASATWNRNGITVAGGNGKGPALNQLNYPYGLFVDDDAAVYVVDSLNYRIVKWMPGVSSDRVVAGGNGEGNRNNQLSYATKVVVDRTGTMFICDSDNKRVQRWLKNDNHGQTIIANISCIGLAMDNKGSLYVSDNEKYCVTTGEQVVAGGNGQGSAFNQFWNPDHIFVDNDQSVFVVDFSNDRVMKWSIGSKEGIVVAGGNGWGNGTNQLSAIKYSRIMLLAKLVLRQFNE